MVKDKKPKSKYIGLRLDPELIEYYRREYWTLSAGIRRSIILFRKLEQKYGENYIMSLLNDE